MESTFTKSFQDWLQTSSSHKIAIAFPITFDPIGRQNASHSPQIYHNYIREHEGLDGKTPAEACGIKIEGKNKWKTLIQNASL